MNDNGTKFETTLSFSSRSLSHHMSRFFFPRGSLAPHTLPTFFSSSDAEHFAAFSSLLAPLLLLLCLFENAWDTTTHMIVIYTHQ